MVGMQAIISWAPVVVGAFFFFRQWMRNWVESIPKW